MLQEKLLNNIQIQPESECWIWQGYLSKGYGRVRVGTKRILVHRASYESFIGRIPSNMTIDHICNNTACINPNHLRPSSQRENILRGNGLAARNRSKELCKRGHKYDYVSLQGKRQCTICAKILRDAKRKVLVP